LLAPVTTVPHTPPVLSGRKFAVVAHGELSSMARNDVCVPELSGRRARNTPVLPDVGATLVVSATLELSVSRLQSVMDPVKSEVSTVFGSDGMNASLSSPTDRPCTVCSASRRFLLTVTPQT